MTKAVNLGFFKGYEISEVALSHLQYVNETFLICEACVKNLWHINVILKWFELMSELKANFSK